ncbi:MAG: bacillithiol biosynthesis cysteine-adding enzyme BshC [Fibrobacterales bacterium]
MAYLSPLFQRLIEEFDQECKTVYPSGVATTASADTESLFNRPYNSYDRALLTSMLRDEQERYGCSKETADTITLLKKSSTTVVVTGQQPSISGGPLMILYKALTAVALADTLSQNNETSVVPLFWIAGDDSDLKECNFSEDLLTGKAHTLDFTKRSELIQMSHRYLDTERHNVLLDIISVLNGRSNFLSLIESGISIADQFGKLLQSLLGTTGLIFVDGSSDLVKHFGRGVLNSCVEHHEAVEDRLLEGKALLESIGVQSPVDIRSSVIRAFVVSLGHRSRVTSKEERHAEHLSHDVLTRPLVCDSIFPVVAHVLGPAELRYFGVLAPLYQYLSIPFPMVFPRCHATIGFNEFYDLAESLGCEPAQIPTMSHIEMVEQLGKKILTEQKVDLSPLTINDSFLKSIEHLDTDALLHRYLLHTIERVQQKIEKKLCKKAIQDDSILKSRIDTIYRWFGSSRKQERLLQWPSLERSIAFDKLLTSLDPLGFEHQYISLEQKWNR